MGDGTKFDFDSLRWWRFIDSSPNTYAHPDPDADADAIRDASCDPNSSANPNANANACSGSYADSS